MALIDKETIRAEIERLIEINKTKRGFPAGTSCAIRIDTYEHLLNFLDTLPEQPVEGLEEEVDEYVKKQWDMLTSTDSTKSIVRRIARHFAEWQKKRDDLETADLLAIAHLQGMEQQKAKMMERAVKV